MKQPEIKPMTGAEKSIFLIPVAVIVLVFAFTTCQAQIGYQPTTKKDTVPAAILITDWDDNKLPHDAYVINGYAVRKKYTYFGDRMPPGEYDDYFEVEYYLDYHHKTFGPGVIVWDAKINYKRGDLLYGK